MKTMQLKRKAARKTNIERVRTHGRVITLHLNAKEGQAEWKPFPSAVIKIALRFGSLRVAFNKQRGCNRSVAPVMRLNDRAEFTHTGLSWLRQASIDTWGRAHLAALREYGSPHAKEETILLSWVVKAKLLQVLSQLLPRLWKGTF